MQIPPVPPLSLLAGILLAAAPGAFAQRDVDRTRTPGAPRTFVESPAEGLLSTRFGATPEELHTQWDPQGTFWCRGRTYKASFGTEGASYIPFLGSKAPRNFPLTMRVAEARLGTRSLPLGPPSVRHEGDRAVIERGALRAEYVLGLDAVEQLFVLDAAPRGSGDLVVRLDVETELSPIADGAGWNFQGPHGGVHYGEAFVIDAAGRRQSMDAAVDARSIELVVPAAFLAEAHYPLAIDPLIGTSSVDDSSRDQGSPDIAWDPARTRYTVVLNEAFSASDFDIKLWSVSGSGVVIGAPLYADLTDLHTFEPKIAVCAWSRRALVVYLGRPQGQNRDVESNLIDLDTFSAAGRVRLNVDPQDFEVSSPDVGGDAFAGTSAVFTVVWSRETAASAGDIVLRRVEPTGTLQPQTLLTQGGQDDIRPAISNCIPLGRDAHTIAWVRSAASDTVMVAQVNFAGLLSVPAFSADTGAAIRSVDVSSLGQAAQGEVEASYLLVVEHFIAADNDSDLELVLGVEDRTLDRQILYRSHHTNFFDDHRRAVVAATSTGFALAYEGAPTAAQAHSIYLDGIDIANRQIALRERRVLADTFSGAHFTPALCSAWETGDAPSGHGPYATVSRLFAGGGSDIVMGIYGSGQASGAQFGGCYGIANSAGERSFLSIHGSASNIAPRTMRVTGLPPNKSGIFFASRNTSLGGIAVGSGLLCLLAPVGRFPVPLNSGQGGTVDLTLDPSDIRQPGGAVMAAPGDTWYFQFWHRDSGGTSNFSNAAGIPFY